METDISIRNRPHTRSQIIDTKFYKETFQHYYDSAKLHSANLYQMLAYLQNLRYRAGPDAEAKGMLLYPVVNQSVHLHYELAGHDISICTVNLAADWQSIRRELLALLEF